MEPPLKAWIRALEKTASIQREPFRTFPLVIDQLARERGDAVALSSPQLTLSYSQLSADARRIARWSIGNGLNKGDVVCLLMQNCPEYLSIWMGLTSVGITVALLNNQLSGSALAHCIAVAAPRLIIVDASLERSIESAEPLLFTAPSIWILGDSRSSYPHFDIPSLHFSSDPLTSDELRSTNLRDTALLIYTSGTTGLPKAAKVSHARVMQWTHWFAGMMQITQNDRMYNCLPLYHSVGGVVAAGATLAGGGAVILRERFSSHSFWNDIQVESCTLFQYIGELCRYLLAAPSRPNESRHSLRLCCGNGLRGEVWKPFQERFKIPKIVEYYAATEGNFSLYNCEGRIGSVGRIPPFLAHRMPVELVEFDDTTQAPLRNPDGFCVRCATGCVGEAIGQIAGGEGHSVGSFEGYVDEDATSKKILRNVFQHGDSWYRTGDLMRQDADGFFYFSDRIGDTYRWKGENVSTAEVAAAILLNDYVLDAVVYGVSVPNADGRAGMAAVVVKPGFSISEFKAHIDVRLPPYARPEFLRIVSAIELTGTLKLSKQKLVDQAFDPSNFTDPLFYADRESGTFLPLTKAVFAALGAGTMHL